MNLDDPALTVRKIDKTDRPSVQKEIDLIDRITLLPDRGPARNRAWIPTQILKKGSFFRRWIDEFRKSVQRHAIH